MIESIEIHNFLSFRYLKLDLESDVNTLIGINGSGKTNFLHAFGILNSAFSKEISFERYCLELLNGFDSFFYKGDKPYGKEKKVFLKYVFSAEFLNSSEISFVDAVAYELHISSTKSGSLVVGEKLYTVNENKTFTYLDSVGHKKQLARIDDKVDGNLKLNPLSDDYYDNEYLVLPQINDFSEFRHIAVISKLIANIDFYLTFDLSRKSDLRKPGIASAPKFLLSDGSNFVSFLNYIQLNHRSEYKKLIENLQLINPSYEDMGFEHYGDKIGLQIFEKGLNKATSIERISEGTLKFIVILLALLNPNRKGIITIDEPDNFLHYNMLTVLANLIKDSGCQILITTHNPVMVDLLGLDSIVFLEKKANEFNVYKPSKEDPKLAEKLDRIGAGTMWLNGYFEGLS